METGLCLGSNLDDRLANLSAAGVRLLSRSSVFETDPIDVLPCHADKPFLNAVLVVDCDGPPTALAVCLHEIENDLGRLRVEDRNAPRKIDIDMIYADGLELRTQNLALPHPRWFQRRFVVQPLAEVRPDLVLPGCSLCVADLLATLPHTPGVRLLTAAW